MDGPGPSTSRRSFLPAPPRALWYCQSAGKRSLKWLCGLLWLVLLVLWIGGVGYVTWRTFPVDDWVVACEAPVGSSSCDTTSKPAWLYEQMGKEERAAITYAVVLALLPPAFVLAFGSALVWVFRGFR
jgi:hypothetical protein